MRGMTIGEVARQAKVNLQTVRYYERRSLLPKPDRTSSNYRSFAPDTVRRIRFIKRAQELGFTLREIKGLLTLRAQSESPCADVFKQVNAKLVDIDTKLRDLQAIRRALAVLMVQCPGKGTVTDCPIVDALDGNLRD